jgi:carboxymethylenebutenolidase
MIGQSIEIAMPRGVMDAYLARPDGEPRPLVILFMDIWGLREELFALARRIAAEGYCCIVPNLFYREGKFRFAPRNDQGRTVSFDALAEDVRNDMLARAFRLDRGTAREDVAGIVAFCRGEPVRTGRVGVIGICMSGREALFAAQEFPDRIRAAAILHGTRLLTEDEDSPHLGARAMRGEVYCGFGALDRGAPPEMVARLAQTFAGVAGLRYRSRTHPGACHGYALPDRDVYDRAAAEADWAEIFSMLRRQLAP